MDVAVLDTDVASRIHKGTIPDDVRRSLAPFAASLTFVTVAEMLRGALRAQWGPRRIRELEDWIAQYPQLDSDPVVSRQWAKVVAERENAGKPINPNDAWIAACCINAGFPLATFNRKHFVGIEGLELVL
jgi:tRNA(fMet)-specific endonuclease VapC